MYPLLNFYCCRKWNKEQLQILNECGWTPDYTENIQAVGLDGSWTCLIQYNVGTQLLRERLFVFILFFKRTYNMKLVNTTYLAEFFSVASGRQET